MKPLFLSFLVYFPYIPQVPKVGGSEGRRFGGRSIDVHYELELRQVYDRGLRESAEPMYQGDADVTSSASW